MNEQCSGLSGRYRDILHRQGQRRDLGWRSNIIVDQCRQLLAAFMRGETAGGVNRIELGTGDPAWDALPAAPAPAADTEALVDTAPVSIAIAGGDIAFINPAGETVTGPASTIEITVQVEAGSLPLNTEGVYPLREFALFGQIGSQPFMIDYVRHAVMNLGTEDALTRRIRLAF